MTAHDLALLAIDDALKEAEDSVRLIKRARVSALARNYNESSGLLSEAISAASYADNRCSNARRALEACK